MKKNIFFLFIIFFTFSVFSEEELSDELKALRADALKESLKNDVVSNTGEQYKDISFKSGGLSLQALNPEISVTGDLIGTYSFGEDVDNNFYDWNFRSLGLHFETYLDPYSKFKAAIPINSGGAELGEAYFTRYGIFKNTNITLGKFRQQFGVINRWHKHALDFYDFPLPIQMIFGAGGLNQTGLSIDVLNSFNNTSQEVTLQITDGDNAMINKGNVDKRPNVLIHYKNYRDLTSSTYFEVGLTGLIAWNNQWDVYQNSESSVMEKSLSTEVYGLDFTIMWEPTDRMRYRNLELRSEIYLCQKDILAYDGSGTDSLDSFGWYISLNTKINRIIDVGAHIDYYEPDSKSYASLSGFPYSSYAVSDDNANRWLISMYLTYFQSPFVKFRVEYDHEDGDSMEDASDKLMFQMVFAAGPHKHERY